MQALCSIRRGEDDAASARLYRGLEKLSAARYGVFNWFLQAEFARCMAITGRSREGLAVFERAKTDLDEYRWYAPNCVVSGVNWRWPMTKGLKLEGVFFRCAGLSDRQASLSWALRAATSLAIAENSVGRKEAAWRTLQATYAKFRKGLETPICGWPGGIDPFKSTNGATGSAHSQLVAGGGLG